MAVTQESLDLNTCFPQHSGYRIVCHHPSSKLANSARSSISLQWDRSWQRTTSSPSMSVEELKRREGREKLDMLIPKLCPEISAANPRTSAAIPGISAAKKSTRVIWSSWSRHDHATLIYTCVWSCTWSCTWSVMCMHAWSCAIWSSTLYAPYSKYECMVRSTAVCGQTRQ